METPESEWLAYTIHVRDSKDEDGPRLSLSPTAREDVVTPLRG
ncbi:DUF397 domain-containing protein [Streptomyces sp. JW3]